MSKDKPVSHNDLQLALATRYTRPHWLFMSEVKDCTGFGWSRSADGVAFGLYSSRGHEIHVFECKAQRGDWLKELRSPEKAEAWAAVADKFWIVAPKGIVQKSELPLGWGLITVSRGGKKEWTLRTTVQAKKNTMDNRQLSRAFCASMIVNANKRIEQYEKHSVLVSEVEDRIQGARKAGFERGKANLAHSRLKDDLERLKKAVYDFEKASGIKIPEWRGSTALGAKVKLVEGLETIGFFSSERMSHLLQQLDANVERVKNAMNTIGDFARKSIDP